MNSHYFTLPKSPKAQKPKSTKALTMNTIKVKCEDGELALSYAIATASRTLLTILNEANKTQDSEPIISVPLIEKHFRYLEFYLAHGFSPPLPLNELVNFYKEQKCPEQSIDDQLILIEAMAWLDIGGDKLTMWVDWTVDGYYRDQGIE